MVLSINYVHFNSFYLLSSWLTNRSVVNFFLYFLQLPLQINQVNTTSRYYSHTYFTHNTIFYFWGNRSCNIIPICRSDKQSSVFILPHFSEEFFLCFIGRLLLLILTPFIVNNTSHYQNIKAAKVKREMLCISEHTNQ